MHIFQARCVILITTNKNALEQLFMIKLERAHFVLWYGEVLLIILKLNFMFMLLGLCQALCTYVFFFNGAFSIHYLSIPLNSFA